MKKLLAFLIITATVFALMFAEYRYIMHNICPSYGADGSLYIEVFGSVDTYYIE